MKNKIHLLSMVMILPIICLSQNFENDIYSPFFLTEKKIIKNIADVISYKRILILGETGHGDGKSFEYKIKIIKYLVKHEGYNVVALEGGGYFDFEYLKGVLPKDTSLECSFYSSWFSVWSLANQTQPLVELFEKGKIDVLGIENQSVGLTHMLIPYCEKLLVSKSTYDWDLLDSIGSNICNYDTLNITIDDARFLKTEINRLKTEFKKNKKITRALDNFSSFIEQYILGFFTYEGQNLGINIRDKQMATNVINYINENPKSKMIIWTANFHGAKCIKEISYGKKEDPFLYNRFKLLGEYLYETYQNDVYSLAFTSSIGKIGYWWDEQGDTISIYKNNLEYQLLTKNINYGFLNFTNEKNRDQVFYSSLLGYFNKKGKWMLAYDGIFYIKENEKAIRKK